LLWLAYYLQPLLKTWHSIPPAFVTKNKNREEQDYIWCFSNLNLKITNISQEETGKTAEMLILKER